MALTSVQSEKTLHNHTGSLGRERSKASDAQRESNWEAWEPPRAGSIRDTAASETTWVPDKLRKKKKHSKHTHVWLSHSKIQK